MSRPAIREPEPPRQRASAGSGFFARAVLCAGCGRPFLPGQRPHFALVRPMVPTPADGPRFHEICLPVGAR